MRRRDKSIRDIVNQHNRILSTIMANTHTSRKEKNDRIDKMNAIGSKMETNIRRSKEGKEYLEKVGRGYEKIDRLSRYSSKQGEMYEAINANNKLHSDFENKKFSYSTRAGING